MFTGAKEIGYHPKTFKIRKAHISTVDKIDAVYLVKIRKYVFKYAYVKLH